MLRCDLAPSLLACALQIFEVRDERISVLDRTRLYIKGTKDECPRG
jgi:hypothetical protein